MKQQHSFTLVELLTVIGIIAILAGLLLPAVMLGQQKGRITQAKADMHTLMMAMKSVENTYQQMLNPKSGVNMPLADHYLKIGGIDSNVNAYEKYIVELSDPRNNIFKEAKNLNINKRRIQFLDPKSGYDPSKDGTDKDNLPYLWRDPWGNRYVIIFNVDFTDKIELRTAIGSGSEDKTIAGNVAIYSFGPNGQNDNGKNVEDGTGEGREDDIVSWK